MNNQQRITAIRHRLQEALQPTHLQIVDDSAHHRNHPGAQSGGGHFTIHISSPVFQDKPLIIKHRMIYQALSDLMNSEIHALRIFCWEP